MNFNNWKYRILICVLLFPLFFINVKDSHDWGDDFAQYLIQARNIVESRPQTDNGLLLDAKDPAFAIQAYPVGLPLLIAPIYYFFNLSIYPYCILFSLTLFLTGIFIFEFFRKRTNGLMAIIITLLFCYNVNILDLKKQILSEIPFTCAIMFAMLWIETNTYRRKNAWLITGVIFAIMVSLRLAGLTALVGYVLFEINIIRKNKKISKEIIRNLIMSLLTFALLFLTLNGLIYPVNVPGLFGFYSNAFESHEIQAATNLKFYYTVSEYVFPFLGSWIPSWWILIAFAGWLIRLIKAPSVIEYFFPFYYILIVFYPYANAGIRFLIPVLPFMFFYCGYFIHRIFIGIGEKAQWISTAILIIPLLAYAGPLRGIIKSQKAIEDGPHLKTAVELFANLKTTPQNSVIVFCKARAMSLYSGHPTLYMGKQQSDEDALKQFHRYKSLYVVVTKAPPDNEIYDQRLLDFINKYNSQYEKIWENDWFNVYRQR